MSIATEKTTQEKKTRDPKKEREQDHKMVKGVFRCYEPMGGSFTFNFKKYKGDQVLKYTMVDGEVYEVPMMIAKHLNNNCWYPRHSHVMDINGNPTLDVGKKVKRCSFESLAFHEED
jgi:hypothetical protein